MDRSLDEIVAERQRTSNRGSRRGPPPPRRGNNNNNNHYPRDGVRKPARDDRANLDNDWVHDRFDDEPSSHQRGGYNRQRGRRDDRDSRNDNDRDRDRDRERDAPVHKIRVDNLHYDLTEEDLHELFGRIGEVADVKMRFDRAGRSEGIAHVSYYNRNHADRAIKEFDGANAKGQPIRLQLLPPPRRDNPFDRVENPRSLFDRIEAPSGRGRRRSESPTSELEDDRGYRSGPRRNPPARDRRSDITKPAPENIDRYVPGSNGGRSDSRRGGRRPGERRERQPRRDDGGPKSSGGRPRKTQEELDAEMEDYWGNSNTENGQTGTATNNTVAQPQPAAAATLDVGDDMMIE